ncbi:SusC/RagA family TonB-linked outer membrane protein [Pedobacter sp. SL55]|uniref:SusC/RagA family TonB-linked outer membrane protein n=1 Tax=Pedobacter sp. SL55 TaxID=2995161 RepID=UPI00226F142D|nr:TonB-dependent receptor [Pedobacter sp. SL55]WAC41884.1 TonB-dependent receptor [Pedobacter sp. SL55]
MKKLLQSLFILLFVATTAMAQNRTITGTVTSKEDGLPLPGVSVKVKGTNVGTSTAANGKFSLSVPSSATALEFTSIGFAAQTITIGSATFVDASLSADANALTEVIVTGYTTTSKERFSGAASSVSSKSLEQVPMGSFDQMLQGRAPGLQALAGSGQPGSNATAVVIRGQGSINGGNGPIYILDGVPIESGVFSTMNANDFESVTVLKDASATAAYGSRGANGVIVITSKKGVSGQTVVTYRNQFGFSNRTSPNFEMMTTAQRLQYEFELGSRGVNTSFPGWTLSRNNPSYASQTPAVQARRDFQLDSLSKINTDWTDLFFRTGSTQQHEINISGGSDKTRFFTSGSYYNQDGIAIRSNLERYNFRGNIDHTSGRFTLGVQTALGFSRSQGIESEGAVALANPFAAVYLGRPYENPFIYDGRIGLTSPTANPLGLTNIGMFGNPLFDSRVGSIAYDRIFNTLNNFNQIKGTLGLTGRFKITDYLSAKSTTGIDYRETNNTGFVNPASLPGTAVATGNQGSYSEVLQRNYKFINTSGLEFAKTFEQKHAVGGQALFEYIYDGFKRFQYTGYGINPKLPNTPVGVSAGTATNNFIPVTGGQINKRAIYSLIALANYTYDGKYTLDASFRRDGSSLLPEQNRYRNFYSFGGNWNMTREEFMKDLTFVNLLKFRASYGVAANAEGIAADFGYLPTYGAITYAGTPAIAPTRPADPNYDWEFTYTANLGLDFELYNNRIRGNVDVYDRRTKNVFVSEGLSSTTGFASLTKNAGTVQNKGIEVALSYDIISNRSRQLVWTVDANFAYNRNEVLDLGGVNEFESGTSIIRVGLPLGSHYVVRNGGVNPANGDQLWVNRDGTTTTLYSASQSVAEFGSFRAPMSGGFSSTLRYKGFEVSAFFSFVNDLYRFNNEVFFLTNSGQSQFGQLSSMLTDSWKAPGDVARYPRYGVQRQFNSDDIENASFLRFRNAVIGYNLPKTLLSKVKYVRNARVFAQGQNLYTWTKWRGFDPEDNNNLASFEYPAARTFTFGLDISF